MAGNSESYTQRLASLRAKPDVDRRMLARLDDMSLPPRDRCDLFNRDRARIERDIDWQERVIRVAEVY